MAYDFFGFVFAFLVSGLRNRGWMRANRGLSLRPSLWMPVFSYEPRLLPYIFPGVLIDCSLWLGRFYYDRRHRHDIWPALLQNIPLSFLSTETSVCIKCSKIFVLPALDEKIFRTLCMRATASQKGALKQHAFGTPLNNISYRSLVRSMTSRIYGIRDRTFVSHAPRTPSIMRRMTSDTVTPSSLARFISHFNCGSVKVTVCRYLMWSSMWHHNDGLLEWCQ